MWDILWYTIRKPFNAEATQQAEKFMGGENVLETEVRMGAEDFGYYTQLIPGCFYRLGVMNTEKGIVSGVHTPTFNIDETAIEIGMGMMAWLGASVGVTASAEALAKAEGLIG